MSSLKRFEVSTQTEAGNSGKGPLDLGPAFLALNEYSGALVDERYSDYGSPPSPKPLNNLRVPL